MELISILLTIHAANYLFAAFFKIPITTLNCGLYGFSGKSKLNKQDMRLALAKFKILGLYNETRGKDSCGVVINNVIQKGIGPKKLFTDFIEDAIFETNPKNRIFLGHNRSASSGFSMNDKNQHPFVVEDDLMLTHNGTLKDTYNFCKKYEVPYAKVDVDSEMLAIALYNYKEEVLCNYKGMAALAYTFKTKPNTLYLYHGASKQYKNGKEVEERPLYYMKTKEGIYYSSMPEPLFAIRENDEEEPYTLVTNIVFEIIDGEFTENEIVIERAEINIEIPKVQGRMLGFGEYSEFNTHHRYTPSRHFPTKTITETQEKSDVGLSILSIRRESLPKRVIEDVYSDYIYFYRSRYYTHYTDRTTDLAQGKYYITAKKGYINENPETEGAIIKYFYKGVLLKDEVAFRAIEDKSKDTYNSLDDEYADWAFEMSKFADQPVYALPNEGRTTYRWYLDGKSYDGIFLPFFSGRSYTIGKGFLSSIKSSHKEELCFHPTQELADQEKLLYIAGGLISPIFPPIVTTVLTLPPSALNEDNNTPFYLRKFKNKSQFYNICQDLELRALDTYIKWFLANDVAWSIDDSDVFLFRETMMEELISKSQSIEQWVGDSQSLSMLKKTFKELILEEQSTLVTEKNEGQIIYTDINDEDNEDNDDDIIEDSSTELEEIVENILDSFSELHNNANELQMIDLVSAQSLAHNLYSVIDNFRGSCENTKELTDQPQFMQFIENIKELKNGII